MVDEIFQLLHALDLGYHSRNVLLSAGLVLLDHLHRVFCELVLYLLEFLRVFA